MNETDDETKRGCALIFLSIFSFLFFLYFSYATYMYCGFTPKSNPTVEGVVVKSAIEKSIIDHRRGYDINVTYEYHVDGKKYLSDRICCGESSNESSKEIVDTYPIGTKVTVYYRENNPRNSVIEPRLGRSGPVLAYGFGFLFILSLFISFCSPHNSGWIALGMFGLFILLGDILMIIYPPNNSDAAVNNPITNIVMHFVFVSLGLACLIYSYIMKKQNT